jgi:hypothetical protein
MNRILAFLTIFIAAAICSAQPAAAPTFKPGKFNCYIYMSGRPILADTVTFAPSGTYTTRGGGAKTGKYEFDSNSSKVKVSGGPLEGADLSVEATGAIRLLHKENQASTNKKWASMYCSPEKK